MLVLFLALLTLVSCQSAYSQVSAPPSSFALSKEGFVDFTGSLDESNCSYDPTFIQGVLTALGSATYRGLVFRGGGGSQQVYLALSTDGLHFEAPIKLDQVLTNQRSVAAIIFNGRVHIGWEPLNDAGNVKYAQFDGVSGVPLSTPALIPNIVDAEVPAAFAITRTEPKSLSLFWVAASDYHYISYVTYDSSTSSWSVGTTVNTEDYTPATVALVETGGFTVLAYSGYNDKVYGRQTNKAWTQFGDRTNTDLRISTVYRRPALVWWPIPTNANAVFLVMTNYEDGNLSFNYRKADGEWDWDNAGTIKSGGSQVHATSAPAVGLLPGANPQLAIYYCQRALNTLDVMAYGIVAPK